MLVLGLGLGLGLGLVNGQIIKLYIFNGEIKTVLAFS